MKCPSLYNPPRAPTGARNEAAWKKTQLVPCWILQFVCAVALAVMAILLLDAAADARGDETDAAAITVGYSDRDLVVYANLVGSIILAFSLVTIISVAAECMLFGMRMLLPTLVVAFSGARLGIWCLFFILAVVSAALGVISPLDLVLGFVLACTSLLQLIFTFWHKLGLRRKRAELEPERDLSTRHQEIMRGRKNGTLAGPRKA